MSLVQIVIADSDTHLVYVEEYDVEIVLDFLQHRFSFWKDELDVRPLDALSSLDIGAIHSGLRKYLVDFFSHNVDGRLSIGEVANVSETSVGELHKNGWVRKTAAYVWAHNEDDAILRARRVLLDALEQ